jgi:sarcosine oxidase
MPYDVVVIGQGAAGSAALYHLARRGHRVLGLERFTINHDRASSHGETRIIRLGYFEHPSYVPLVRAAYTLWRELEAASGETLMHITGIAEMGKPDSELVTGTLASSRQHGLTHEVLDARELMRRYPVFALPNDFVAVMQPEGGYVNAAKSVRVHTELAVSAGAELRENVRVRAIEPRAESVRVVTDQGTFDAGSVIVAAGAWVKELLPSLPCNLFATRQALMWVSPADPAPFREPAFPVWMLESELGIHYGFPWSETEGLKVALHHHERETVDPETYDRAINARDEALIRAGLTRFMPQADAPTRATKSCLYTMTDDGDFVLDRMPGHPQIVVASPCSGHGFKFSPVIGEVLADLATMGGTKRGVKRFGLGRFNAIFR